MHWLTMFFVVLALFLGFCWYMTLPHVIKGKAVGDLRRCFENLTHGDTGGQMFVRPLDQPDPDMVLRFVKYGHGSPGGIQLTIPSEADSATPWAMSYQRLLADGFPAMAPVTVDDQRSARRAVRVGTDPREGIRAVCLALGVQSAESEPKVDVWYKDVGTPSPILPESDRPGT